MKKKYVIGIIILILIIAIILCVFLYNIDNKNSNSNNKEEIIVANALDSNSIIEDKFANLSTTEISELVEKRSVDKVSIQIKEGTLTKEGATIVITDTHNPHYTQETFYRIDKSEYEIFSSTIKNIIAFSQRYKHAIGIIAFKISNASSIREEYGNAAYKKLEDELIKAIKKNARIGENQCLLYEGIIYSVIFANEEEAWKATKRYFKALKNYNFEYNDESVDINVSMAVSGFDFSNNMSNKMSVFVVKDNMMKKIKDALNESEETGSPVIYYE